MEKAGSRDGEGCTVVAGTGDVLIFAYRVVLMVLRRLPLLIFDVAGAFHRVSVGMYGALRKIDVVQVKRRGNARRVFT